MFQEIDVSALKVSNVDMIPGYFIYLMFDKPSHSIEKNSISKILKNQINFSKYWQVQVSILSNCFSVQLVKSSHV